MSGIFSSSRGSVLFGREDEAQQAPLEQAADELLFASHNPAAEYPFHTENWLRRCQEKDGTGPAEAGENAPLLSSAQWCLRMLSYLHLPTRWRLAFRLAMRGYTQREIAGRLHTDPARISLWLKRIRGGLREALRLQLSPLSRDEQIREAWRSETGRHAYTAEKHCKPGREACRKTGLCTRRWYLHYMSE